jgi:membrane-associated phospholipid phosphatase
MTSRNGLLANDRYVLVGLGPAFEHGTRLMTASAIRPKQAEVAVRKRAATVAARRAALTALISILLFGAVYVLALRTGVGQRFENAVWFGAGQTSTLRTDQATNALSWIGDTSGSIAVAGIFLIGLLRRRIVLALAGVGVVAASVGTAEFLKDTLARPNLVPSDSSPGGNSFPSGHTTVAMAIMFALILVVPYRIRGMVAFCSAALATEIGALTIVARWHRPSDTLGADLIVLCYASLAILILALFGHARPADLRTAVGKTARGVFFLGPLAIGTVTALCGALLFAAVTYYHRVVFAPVFETSHAAFFAGCLFALAGSGLVTLTLLWLLGRLDLVPVSRPEEH